MNENDKIDYIEHKALVLESNPSKGFVKVRVDDEGECGDCPAANLCKANGQASNTLTIPTSKAAEYRENDIITLQGTEQLHRKAIMIATVLPCIAMIAVMVSVFLITASQLTAALSGIATMLVFFNLLWIMRNKIAHEFSFKITGKPEREGNAPQK